MVTARLFIAVDIPEYIRSTISDFRIPSDAAKIRWVEKDNIHLTLRFLGDTEEKRLDEIVNALRKVEFSPFRCSVSGFGVFPDMHRPRVIWAGITPEDDVIYLHKKIDDALDDPGFQKEMFTSHITIGRVKIVSDLLKMEKHLHELMEKHFSMAFTVSCFKLKKSTLTPDGPVYEDVMSF
ncbi:MAG: RNA 2',3'-cyclic phosphodiesterase [Candidatus Aenigmarchaeota archaeon]|nr:RNA 2',3'-cyclic phosphodiesterase [Candidatus Aenigmarchaeota archaeon]